MFKKCFFYLFFLLPLLLASSTGISQRILFVDHSANCPGNGASWATAYCHLQDALIAASDGDQIWVAAGVYFPDRGAQVNLGDRGESFRMKSGVEIYGGFIGNETDLNQRDYNQNPSILSGNIRNLNTHNTNSNTVVNATGTNRSAVLDGFIIEDGLAMEGCSWTAPSCSGGNIFFMPGSPTLRNLIVRNGRGSYGGGLSMLDNCNPLIENVFFINNQSSAFGGAIHIRNNCSPEFINCTFEGNSTVNHGGAIHCRDNSTPTFTNCIFTENSGVTGGAVIIQFGSTAEFFNCSFYNNHANSSSGGVHFNNNSGGRFENCHFEGNLANNNGGAIGNHANSSSVVINSVFRFNEANILGGALRNTSNSRLEVFNSTIYQNSAAEGGGLYNNDSELYLTESEVFSNQSANYGGGLVAFGHSSNHISHSAFYDNQSQRGGGIYIRENSSIIMEECEIVENSASKGAGLGITDVTTAAIEIKNSTFSENIGLGSSTGLGLYISHCTDALISECTFSNHSASGNSYGGGIGIYHSSRVRVEYSGLFSNTAIWGGGIHIGDESEVLVVNCHIRGNQSNLGGGVKITNQSKVEMVNTLISGNHAQSGGGIHSSTNPTITLRNTTIAANHADSYGGGVRFTDGTNVQILNSIIYLNSGNQEGNEVYLSNNSNLAIQYSCIQDNNGDLFDYGAIGSNDISVVEDPNFVAPIHSQEAPSTQGDFRLLRPSPAIDVGSNLLIQGYPVDLDLNPRILNQVVDMGAFENMQDPCEEEVFIEICPGEVVFGVPIYSDTLFIENFIGDNDCDSTIFTYVEVFEVVDPALDIASGPCTIDSATIRVINHQQFDTFIWNQGAEEHQITVFESGTYTINSVDSNGCHTQNTIDIEINFPIEIEIELTTENSNYHDPDGSIEIIIQGGTPPYQIEWDNGESSTIIDGLSAGIYCVEILDQLGCLYEDCFEIENTFPDLVVDYEPSPIHCPEEESGEIKIVITDGTPPIVVLLESLDGSYMESFLIDTVPFDFSVDQLPLGDYLVKTQDFSGQEVLFAFSLEAPPVIELISSDIRIWPCDSLETLGKIEVEATGGTPPLMFQWNGDLGLEPSLEFYEYGIYELIIIDSLGCKSAPFEFEITEPDPLKLEMDAVEPDCPGIEDGHIGFSISGGAPPYTVYVNEEELPGPPFEIHGLDAGEYGYIITDFNGCSLEGFVTLQYQNEYYLEIRESQTISLGDTIFLEGMTNMDRILSEVWSPDSLLRLDPPLGIWAFPFEDTTYELILINENGCEIYGEVHILVTPTDYEVFIPNVFSPNRDGINDFFTVFTGSDVAMIEEMIVFNRWGSVVWRNNHFRPNQPDFGWDGYFRGQKLQGGIYVYTARILFKNGVSKNYSGEFLLIE